MTEAVTEQGMNVNRRVICVTGFDVRNVTSLAVRLANCSRLTHLALLESSD
jgi:hypothetical protein